MIITLKPGDVLANMLVNFRPADSIKIEFLTDWDWGHICQINLEPIHHYEKGHILTFNKMPKLNVANASLTGELTLAITRQ